MKKLFIILIGITLACIILPDVMFAQSAPPFLPDKPEHTPIDGGLGILAAAGGAYALKKLRDKEK